MNSMANFFYAGVICFLLVLRSDCDPLGVIGSEDYGDAAVWETSGDSVWLRPVVIDDYNLTDVVQTIERLGFNASTFDGEAYEIQPVYMVLNETVPERMMMLDDIIGLSFEEAESEFSKNINAFIDGLLGYENSNHTVSRGGPWAFVTFVTLVPLRCSDVQKVLALFDTAMSEANPDAHIQSVARRLGASVCDGDGVCPCKDSRRYTTRVMEIHSVSDTRTVRYPSAGRFPYPFEMKAS